MKKNCKFLTKTKLTKVNHKIEMAYKLLKYNKETLDKNNIENLDQEDKLKK